MLSSTFNDLLSPLFSDDAQIDHLFNRTLESLMLHERLYQIQELTICWHQLLDLVQHTYEKIWTLKVLVEIQW